jgi:prevent-host-death family protein
MTMEDIMKTAAVSELKASLSEYLGQVKAGEEVLVTDRGKPIARIIPLGHDETDRPPHLLELERIGLARIGTGAIPAEFWARTRPVDQDGAALGALLSEREDGR